MVFFQLNLVWNSVLYNLHLFFIKEKHNYTCVCAKILHLVKLDISLFLTIGGPLRDRAAHLSFGRKLSYHAWYAYVSFVLILLIFFFWAHLYKENICIIEDDSYLHPISITTRKYWIMQNVKWIRKHNTKFITAIFFCCQDRQLQR